MSEPPPSPTTGSISLPRRAWRAFGRQSTGILLGFASALLLGVGSFYMDRRPAIYGELHLDDVRFFFLPIRIEHLWFYGLVVALGLWGTSALVCTWDSLSSRLRRRVTSPSAYGAPIVHLAFLLALVAHLWGGMEATSSRHVVGERSETIEGVGYRVLRIERELHDNGMPRMITALLERDDHGVRSEVRVGYNHPLSSATGANELLFQAYEDVVDGIVVRHKGEHFVLRPGVPISARGDVMVLRAYHDPEEEPGLRFPVAELLVSGRRVQVPLVPEAPGVTAFVGLHQTTRVLLRHRKNPSVPLVLVVCALLTVGVALTAWERVRTTRGSQKGTVTSAS